MTLSSATYRVPQLLSDLLSSRISLRCCHPCIHPSAEPTTMGHQPSWRLGSALHNTYLKVKHEIYNKLMLYGTRPNLCNDLSQLSLYFLCDLSKKQRKLLWDNQKFKEQGGNYLGNEIKPESAAKGQASKL